jgi:hypothetical protein
MPKKHTPKDQARCYTQFERSRARLEPPNPPSELVKDVTTQLHELRIEHARERQPVKPKMSYDAVINPFGFTFASSTPLPNDNLPSNAVTSARQPTRTIPGPPPPKSWLEKPMRKGLTDSSTPTMVRSRTDVFPPFPDLDHPSPKSLIHYSLLALGTYFYMHQEVNKYYLPQLGIQLKQWLLSYIAVKNIGGAISRDGLNVLFPHRMENNDPEEMEDIIRLSRKDEVYLQYLDLADSLSSNLTLSQLRSFLSPMDLPPEEDNPPSAVSQETWNLNTPRFPNLTHLSLDISPTYTPKFDSLKLAHILTQNCTRLTHLSLAGVFPSATSAGALIHLSKYLVCLEYVDLSRTPALHERYGFPHITWDHRTSEHDKEGIVQRTNLVDRLNWEGGWRNVRTLVVKKCGFDESLEKELRGSIAARRGVGGWIRIIRN